MQLVHRCLDGDGQAQQALVRRFSGLCASVVGRILGPTHRSHIEDVLQEVFLAVFSKLDQWRGQNLPAWIGTLAARRATDARRKIDRRPAPPRDTPGRSRATDATLLGSAGDAVRLVDALDALRKRLSQRQQRIMQGILDGRSQEDMALQLGISARTLYYDLGEIRQAILELLGPVAENEGPQRL